VLSLLNFSNLDLEGETSRKLSIILAILHNLGVSFDLSSTSSAEMAL
jgi:hypothetical protein